MSNGDRDCGSVWTIVSQVPDPELPMVTVADLGILRSVQVEGDRVVVTVTPTYSGCPAMSEIVSDLRGRLRASGYLNAVVQSQLSPPWTSDWITERGRERLTANGISPPSPPRGAKEPTPVALRPGPTATKCPQCNSIATRELAAFGATACRALYRCETCGEPFERIKDI